MQKALEYYHHFKPAIWFILKFLILYVILNVVYGIYIESFGHRVDNYTIITAQHTSKFLNLFNESTKILIDEKSRYCVMANSQSEILSVFEGCNGLNVMIIFISFIFAYSKSILRYWWYLLAGIAVLYLVNIFRISILYYVADRFEHYLYFTHKFVFTGIIYVVVGVLWYLYVNWINK